MEARRSRVPRSGIALATPKAPWTWEGRPRRLRGITVGTHAHRISVVRGEKGSGCAPWGLSGRGGWRAPGRFPGCGHVLGGVGHPFAARGGMECCDRVWPVGVNQMRRLATGWES